VIATFWNSRPVVGAYARIGTGDLFLTK